MRSLRIALLTVVTALLVALVGCEAIPEPVDAETEKAPAAIETSAYASTQPRQASYMASTSGGPTWHRLDEYGYPGSQGTDVPYHVQAFEVGGSGSYQIYSLQYFDGYLLLYGGSFDPAAPSTGFVAGDDDYTGVGDSLVIADLVADTTYYLVTSGYDNYSYGSFMNAIYGPYAVTGPGSLGHVDYTASTAGAPTWDRPNEDGSPTYYGTDVPYHVQAFEVGGAGSYFVESVQEYDGYLFLYGGSFDPTAPSTGFIAGDDDFFEFFVGAGSSLVIADLVADTTYYLVTSGYDSYSYGSFTNAFDGTYAITLKDVGDTSPPVITLYLNGFVAVDDSVWHTSSVNASWEASDPESSVTILDGCEPQSFMTDTTGTPLTCSVSSLGGTATMSFDLKLDQAPPTVLVTGVEDGATYDYGSVPTPGCETTDVTSGVAVAATLQLTGGPAGDVVASCVGAMDNAGNVGGNSAEYYVTADPHQATSDLIDDVNDLVDEGVLKVGQAKGLIKPLENALRSLDKDQPEDACNQLGDFIMEVEAKVPPLTEAQAGELIASAAAIREMLACE